MRAIIFWGLVCAQEMCDGERPRARAGVTFLE